MIEPRRRSTKRSLLVAAFAVWAMTGTPFAAEILAPGFRPEPLGSHALVGGRVVQRPGQVLTNATILIRDGTIQAVGPDLAVPPDARVWDLHGLTVYAGFIEPYLTLGGDEPTASPDEDKASIGTGLTAGRGVDFLGTRPQKTEKAPEGPGYEVARVTPEVRAVRGYAPDKKITGPLRALGFTTAVVAPGKGIIRGTSALVALSDAAPNEVVLKPDVFQHVAFDTRQTGDPVYPASLMGVIAVIRQSFFDARHYALETRAWADGPQTGPRPAFNLALEALSPAATGRARVVIDPGSALMVDRAGSIARELGLDSVLVSSGQEWRRPELAKATAVPFIVPLDFPELPKLPDEADWEQVSLDQLRAWDWAPENPAVLRQQHLEIALTTHSLSDKKKFRKNLRLALDRGLSEDDALAALTTAPAALAGMTAKLGTIEPGKIANLTVVEGKGYFDPEAKVCSVWIDGRNFEPVSDPDKKKEVAKNPDSDTPSKDAPAKAKKQEDKDALRRNRIARSPLEGRGPITNPPAVLVRNATLWTSGPDGILTNAQLFIADGRVRLVGNVEAKLPASTLVIDATGLHVTPGLIDCHSHTAILGGVNEGTLPSTAMVRIGDVVNSETETLREQLAGGLTVANLLHGSANPIGGQNQVIKLRDGASPEELKFEGAPSGIKFALGENVKQSNWGDKNTTRFPQTRMGVRTFFVNRFTAAQQYRKRWQEFEAGSAGAEPPRRDLELEAIAEIIEGKRLIHCHSYRQDEILAFLRAMESFNVRVGTLQHVLEGYKIADEIAAHGAGASSFADWWGYKFEVYDAIPYNGTLMHDRGVLVSFNSDSSDLARRLNTEAAKSVKYGGMPEIEALKLVTVNPAKQLGIDRRVGSLEPGKDADFAIWSGSPLSSTSVCLQTWIEGRQYFDRDLEAKRAESLAQERTALIAKAKQLASSSDGGDSKAGDGDGFFRVSLEHEFDGTIRHCLEEEDHR
jgi:imidazolonepropionase-like amidohydrolase